MRPSTRYSSRAGSGFTLIELMVVVAIIVIISGILIVNLTTTRSKSRDGKRVSDVAQIQLALEQFFERCRQYPSSISGTLTSIANGCPSGVSLATFISQVPKPPGGAGQTEYDYCKNANNTDYYLHAVMESPNQASKDGLSSAPFACFANNGVANSGVKCDNVKDYCVTSR